MPTKTTRKELLADWDAMANQIGDVMADLGKSYGGDPVPGFRSVGLVWQGLLEDYFQIELPPIPPHVVASMMAGLKLSRLCRPHCYQHDDAVDSIAYSFLADHCAKREISA